MNAHPQNEGFDLLALDVTGHRNDFTGDYGRSPRILRGPNTSRSRLRHYSGPRWSRLLETPCQSGGDPGCRRLFTRRRYAGELRRVAGFQGTEDLSGGFRRSAFLHVMSELHGISLPILDSEDSTSLCGAQACAASDFVQPHPPRAGCIARSTVCRWARLAAPIRPLPKFRALRERCFLATASGVALRARGSLGDRAAHRIGPTPVKRRGSRLK